MSETDGDYRAEGIRGQFIYVNPARPIIVVRLGRDRGGSSWEEWKGMFAYIAGIELMVDRGLTPL